MSEPKLPGRGLMGWLGRQVGYVRRAARTKVLGPASSRQVVYRNDAVQEAPLPGRPGVTLRRTVTDEVIVQQPVRTE